MSIGSLPSIYSYTLENDTLCGNAGADTDEFIFMEDVPPTSAVKVTVLPILALSLAKFFNSSPSEMYILPLGWKEGQDDA